MRGHRGGGRALLAAMLVLDAAGVVWAAAGDMDPAYGVGGVATTTADPDSDVQAMVVQSGGRAVLVGDDGAGAWRLERRTATGSADAAFAAAVASAGTTAGYLRCATLDGDDILAAGVRTVTVTSTKGKKGTTTVDQVVVARWLDDGSPDPSFGVDGVAVIPDVAASAPRTLALLPDGRILLGGAVGVKEGSGPKAPYYSAWKVTRLAADGSLDTSFGAGGYVVHNPTSRDDVLVSLVALADGSFVAGGHAGADGTTFPATKGTWSVVRFSASGVATGTASRSSAFAPRLAVDASGNVLAAGVTWDGTQTVVARYDVSGSGLSLDGTFGTGGEAAFGAPWSGNTFDTSHLRVAVDATGRTVVGGMVWPTTGGSNAWVARLGSSGGVDTAFGTSGFVGPIDVGSSDSVAGVAIDDSGRVLLGGVSYSGTSADWFAARVLSD